MNRLAFTDLPACYYTTLCRRIRDLDVMLPVLCSGESPHLVVNSTGLKVFGEDLQTGWRSDSALLFNPISASFTSY